MSGSFRLSFGTAALAALWISCAAAQEPAAVQPPPAGLNPLGEIDKSTLNGFRERPLFTPSRRAPQTPEAAPDPIQEAEAPAAPEPSPQPNLRLTGVVEGPDDSVAVVQDIESNTISQLRLGDMLNGWLVTSIDPVALRLTLGEQEGEYRLFDPSRPPGDAAATEPPPN